MSRKRKKQLPVVWRPKFIEDADSRLACVKELRRRLNNLKQDTNSDSFQKDCLCSRVVFIQAQLESMEKRCLEKGEIDFGSYIQAINCLVGLLKSLGLERHKKSVESLESYIASKKVKKLKRE